MKRNVEIEHCWECPFFREINQYVVRYIDCRKGYWYLVARRAGDEKEIEAFLEDKFLCSCGLELK